MYLGYSVDLSPDLDIEKILISWSFIFIRDLTWT